MTLSLLPQFTTAALLLPLFHKYNRPFLFSQPYPHSMCMAPIVVSKQFICQPPPHQSFHPRHNRIQLIACWSMWLSLPRNSNVSLHNFFSPSPLHNCSPCSGPFQAVAFVYTEQSSSLLVVRWWSSFLRVGKTYLSLSSNELVVSPTLIHSIPCLHWVGWQSHFSLDCYDMHNKW